MLTNYLTVNLHGEDEQVIQKSRFIGHVARTETEEEALQFIQKIKAEHAAATHNCSAYMIGEHDLIQKANDDGEPSGTAGVPILEVLKKQKLKDTTVVVTRYFGGIKLGAGGLIRAYSSTASLTLATTGIVRRQLMDGFAVSVEYPLLGKLENALRQSEYALEGIDYQEKVIFTVYAETEDAKRFVEWMVDLTNDQAHIETLDSKYIDIPHS
ncbi:YigZ family protein [Aciduricibacillus chroicocephali]|uniref:YigZ family protein n=1 Tax=Aciduricibacillus chroicocephali TaxID=3054939 RepID=A0ABY9KT45_9BACI|nr:YigZ family protein [Bacillaceae bacterium 44XB]